MFTCADVDEARVRVNSVEDNRVGLHVSISGIPEGDKRLRVRWRRDVFREVRIGSAEESFADVLEYVYGGLTEPETFIVRVELLVDGRSGSAREAGAFWFVLQRQRQAGVRQAA